MVIFLIFIHSSAENKFNCFAVRFSIMILFSGNVHMEGLKKEGRDRAIKRIQGMFQKPGQLEKLELYKRRIARKASSTDTMLKTEMQRYLDDVSAAMGKLDLALINAADIKASTLQIEEALKELPDLGARLQEVRSKNMRHSQYETAIENLKPLYSVPESVEKAKQSISDGKLLYAHLCLIDLENSRDDLLYELHKLPNQSASDKILLKAYFEDVELVSQMLEKQLKLILGRTLNTVRKEPTIVVSALRIIEREEKSDAVSLQRERQSGFLPPGRPKRWREMAFKELEKCVEQRIEGTEYKRDGLTSNVMDKNKFLYAVKSPYFEPRQFENLYNSNFPDGL